MKLIARIKGGLGNQLFCYAAARRLALQNNSDLVIDDTTGFSRDSNYGRKYALDHFNITARKATSNEKLEPFERVRRGILKYQERCKPFEERIYIEQEFSDFDARVLHLKFKGTAYMDGLWQSELYFADIEDRLRRDLTFIQPVDAQNLELSKIIKESNSVAVHVRWFNQAQENSEINAGFNYYNNAINLAAEKLDNPLYIVFSDNLESAKQKINFPKGRVVFISHNSGDEKAFADLWLMSQCKHVIMANSTFSWWGAWLGGDFTNRTIYFPRLEKINRARWSWDYIGQMPSSWTPITI